MANGKQPKILVIVGPTASGKSDLALRLAKLAQGKLFQKYGIFGAEIISADSRQVYRGMDIGTGKVLKDKTLPVPNFKFQISNLKLRNDFYSEGIKHHLLDVASPKRQFTVAQYQKLGQAAIRKILRKDKLPIIVGGTGFYIDSLINNTVLPEVKPNPKLRAKLEKQTADALYSQLRKLDQRRAKTIDRYNKRRLIRALEIVLTTAQPVPAFIIARSLNYKLIKIGIKVPDAILKKRIKLRLQKRLKQNLPKFLYGKLRRVNMITEIELLHKYGKVSWQRLDDFGLEYRYISRYLQTLEKIDACIPVRSLQNARLKKEEKRLLIKTLEKEIWHYAKRQMTWFKRDKKIHWIENFREAIQFVDTLMKNKAR